MTIIARHTPGPWQANKRHNGWDVYAPDKRVVAEIYRVAEPEICEANARLVAAAPELLEAAKRFIAWIDSGKRGFPSESKLDAAVTETRTAVAKATTGQAVGRP